MKFNGLRLLCLLLLCYLNSVSAAHGCIAFKPVPNFNMDQFLGLWYAAGTTLSPPTECLVHEFTNTYRESNENGKSTGALSDNDVPGNFKHVYNAELIANSKSPSKMAVRSSKVKENVSFDVFATDYVNFAGVYACEKFPDGTIFNSVTILSRKEKLDNKYLTKVKKIMRSAGVNMKTFKNVDHSDCKHTYEQFSASSNDQNIVDGDKKVYSYVTFQTYYVLKPLPNWMM